MNRYRSAWLSARRRAAYAASAFRAEAAAVRQLEQGYANGINVPLTADEIARLASGELLAVRIVDTFTPTGESVEAPPTVLFLRPVKGQNDFLNAHNTGETTCKHTLGM